MISEQEASIQTYERWIKNIKQAAYREGRKSSESLAAWFAPTGSPLDLIDFEKHAEKQQMAVRQLSAVENSLSGLRAR